MIECLQTENYIDGCAFMMLNEEDVRELVPPIGLTKKIMSFVPKVSSADTFHMMGVYVGHLGT